MALLEVQDICKSFGNFKAVDTVSFKVESGKIYGLLGPNGAGKTTTIRMIMNILIPDSGTISLFGEPISEKTKSKIGYLPEERGIFQKMKVRELLTFFTELHGLPLAQGKKLAGEWLEKLELSNWADKKVEELSKGMQQKLQFASTILHDPELIILDEPFSGLDPVNVNLIKNIMLEIKSSGKTIIFSTHMMEAAEKLCDDILMIQKGVKVLDGPINQIREQYGKNSLRLEYSGDVQYIQKSKAVKSIHDYSNSAEIELHEGFTPNDLLTDLLPEITIHSLLSRQSSLNEIFLQLAGGVDNE